MHSQTLLYCFRLQVVLLGCKMTLSAGCQNKCPGGLVTVCYIQIYAKMVGQDNRHQAKHYLM